MSHIEAQIDQRAGTWQSITGKIAATVTAVAMIFAAIGGGASYLLDEMYLPRITASQVSALDEKMGVVNEAVDSLKTVSVELTGLIEKFNKLGIDVEALAVAQRELEIKLERLDATVSVLKDQK